MKSLKEVIAEKLESAGIETKDNESVLQLIDDLNELFGTELDNFGTAVQCSELKAMLGTKNKVYISGKVVPDFGNRGMIDPRLVKARLDGIMGKQ